METNSNEADEADEAAWCEGEADADAGLLIPHEQMVAWLKSWGSENELPPPLAPGETADEAAERPFA